MTAAWAWYALQGFFIAVAASLAVYVWNLQRTWHLRKMQGPSPSWIFGNVLQLGKDFTSHLQFEKWYKKYGPVYKIYFGRTPVVVVTDPDLLKQIFTKSFMKFHDRSRPAMNANVGERVVDEGILFATGRYWTGIRAACEPLFHSEQLQTYVPVANKAMDAMLTKLSALGADQPVQIDMALAGFTMDTIGGTAFGVDFKAQEDASSAIVRHAWNVFRPPAGKSGSFTFFRTLIFAFPAFAPALSKVMARMRVDRIMQLVEARGFIRGASEALLENAKHATPQDDSQPAANGHALLSQSAKQQSGRCNWLTWLGDWLAAPARNMFDAAAVAGQQEYATQQPKDHSLVHNLLAARRKDTGQLMTNGEICAQSFTFILAGYETTSMALTYALYELAQHPDLQQKVVDEVDKFGRARIPSIDDLACFPYIDAVFKEAMRLHPPVTPIVALNREATESVQLGQYHIPKGTKLFINIYSLHHEEKFFPQPLSFRPERFLEGQETHHAYAYIPFGAGPRKCIGHRFATMEGVVALVRLYQQFTFSVNQEKHGNKPLEQQSLITLMPKGGIWLNVHARH